MKHKVFIPVTDEMLYEYPELITAPLRPYQSDHPCFHWMAAIESAHTDETSHNQPTGHFLSSNDSRAITRANQVISKAP